MPAALPHAAFAGALLEAVPLRARGSDSLCPRLRPYAEDRMRDSDSLPEPG